MSPERASRKLAQDSPRVMGSGPKPSSESQFEEGAHSGHLFTQVSSILLPGHSCGSFFGGGASWHGEFPGQGSVVATLGPLTHGAGPGSELPPSAAETPLVPSYHSRDSQLCFNTLQTPTSRPTDFDPPFFFFLLSTRVIFQTNNKRQSLRGPYVFLSFKQVSDSCE